MHIWRYSVVGEEVEKDTILLIPFTGILFCNEISFYASSSGTSDYAVKRRSC